MRSQSVFSMAFNILPSVETLESSVKVENVLLLDSDIPSACEETIRRKRIISRLKETKNYHYSPRVVY